MVKHIVPVVAMLVSSQALCTEYFVDQRRPDDSGDGMTESTAKHTIQAAVDLAMQSGDIVTVLPGEYSEGGRELNGNGFARVCVTNVGIIVRAKQGNAVTRIIGRKATNPLHASGMGDDAVRGVYFCLSGDGTSRIEGFTICDGYTRYDGNGSNTQPNLGGGVSNNGNAKKVYVVDCVITNCVGTRGGGAYNITAVRTRFSANVGSVLGSATRNARHVNCVLEKDQTLSYAGCCVNCSFLGYDSFVTKTVLAGNSGDSVYNVFVESSIDPVISLASDGISSYTKLKNAVFMRSTAAGFPEDCENCKDGAGDVVMASGLGDWRPREGTVASSAGKVAALKSAGLTTAEIDEFCNVDFLGRPSDLSGVDMQVGAYAPATAVCSFSIDKGSAGAVVTLDGHVLSTSMRTNTVHSDVWPTQYLFSAKSLIGTTSMPVRYRQYRVSNFGLVNESWSEVSTARLAPKWPDETLWLTPEKNGHTALAIETGGCYWVDPINGNDENDGKSRDKAVKTWEKASQKSTFCAILFCPAVYDQEILSAGAYGKCRISASGGYRRLIGVNGAEETIIVGARDSAAETDGLGPDAVRCLYTDAGLAVQGFTLTGGYTGSDGGSGSVNVNGAGGAACCFQPVTFVDCVITNNYAQRAAAIYSDKYSTLRGCIIADNHTADKTDGAVRKCCLVGCVLRGNSGDSGAASVGQECRVYGSTVVEAKDGNGRPVVSSSTVSLYNSIVQGGVGPDALGDVKGCVFDGFEYTGTKSDCQFSDPLFVDSANENFRLCNSSPAINQGVSEDVTDYSFYLGNFDSKGVEWNGEGRMTAGAFGSPYAPSVTIVSDIPGLVSPVGTIAVTAGQELEIAVDITKGRPYVGLMVNGEMLFDVSHYILSVPETVQQDWKVDVRAVFGTDFYVNATSGDDGAGGGSWTAARKTLKGALQYALSGDVVHIAPGVYADGEMLQHGKANFTPSLACRAYVPSGVTLISSNGIETAELTIVQGSNAKTDPDQYGMGVDAVRGVYLSSGATLCGVTIRGGRVDCTAVGGKVPEDDNHHGAGVLCEDNTAIVKGCTFIDNVAPRGGASRRGTYLHCRFAGNRATVNSSVSRDGKYYECFCSKNLGTFAIGYWNDIRGCTFDEPDVSAIAGASGNVYNSLFLTEKIQGDSSAPTLVRCALLNNAKLANATCAEDCVVVDAGRLAVSENGVPIVGENEAVDAADMQWRNSDWGDIDAAGDCRISNARMDIGCYEADWRWRYSTDLKSRYLVVTYASSETYEGAETNSLVIPKGSVEVVWQNVPGRNVGRKTFDVQVRGDGVLQVFIDDVPFAIVTKADGLVRLSFEDPEVSENELKFTYTQGAPDSGSAEISNFADPKRGLVLIVR